MPHRLRLVSGFRGCRVDLELVQRDQSTVQQVVVVMDEVTQLGVVINDDDRDRQMVGDVENPGRVDVAGTSETFYPAQDRGSGESRLLSTVHDDVAQRLVVVNRVVTHVDRQLAGSLKAAHGGYQDNASRTSQRGSAR